MLNPLVRIKQRLRSAIETRVDKSVDARTAALMATVHGLSIQLSATASTMADWRLEIERSVANLAKALGAVSSDLERADLESLRVEWSEALSELRITLKKIDGDAGA